MEAPEFPYALKGHGVFRAELNRSGGTDVGYAVVTTEQGATAPAGSAIFQFRANGAVSSEAGVAAVLATQQARIFVDQLGTRTGVAIASPGNPAVTVSFDLLSIDGSFIQTTTRDLLTEGHLAIFVDELFAGLEQGFTGLLEIRSPKPIVPVSLKLTEIQGGDSILTTLPVADLMRTQVTGTSIFPQVGFGESGDTTFATRLISINTDPDQAVIGSLDFFRPDGADLTVPLGEDTGSRFPFQIPGGGGKEFRPGTTTGQVSEIILDSANPASPEVIVNEGSTVQLTPVLLDTEGNVVEGVNLSYTSLSPDIATVDPEGRIQGRRAGFSTLTVAAGGALTTATITVARITSGVEGFEITGIAQDLARRLYLANTSDHTILLTESLQAEPEIYAGVSQSAGLKDDERLSALFRNPAFLTLNQAAGSLYISDGANHVVRMVQPGPNGRVDTLAGSGQAGNEDGLLDQSSFNNPQGLALDSRGNLWVADSGNHTIRRINLVSGTVETVAGNAGRPGTEDGTGAKASFNSPMGIAVETEPLAQQIERQARGQPPLPVQVIVADTGNGLLRRVSEDGRVETVGLTQGPSGIGNRSAPIRLAQKPVMFEAPTGLGVDPFGNIYVTEPNLGRVRMILRSGQVVEAAQADTFDRPNGIAIATGGKLVVADSASLGREITYGAPDIQSIAPESISIRGGEQILITGENFAPDTFLVVGSTVITNIDIFDSRTIRFAAPSLPSGRTTVTVQNRGGQAQTSLLLEPIPLEELPVGHITTVAGGTTFLGDGSLAKAASLFTPNGLTVDATGNLYIADADANRIRKVNTATGIITTVAGNGETPRSRCSFGDDCQIGDVGPAVAAALGGPLGVAVDAEGNILIADSNYNRVRKVDTATGTITTIAGISTGTFGGFSGDGGPAMEAELDFPVDVTIDGEGNLYIVDGFRVRRVDVSTEIISTVAGGGSPADGLGDDGPATGAALSFPGGIAIDPAGNLFITDIVNHRIRKVDAQTGIITTVAGSGCDLFNETCLLGDGGPATEATLAFPADVSVDVEGNLFIADGTFRVRVVDSTSGIITTAAGIGEGGFSGDGGLATEATVGDAEGVLVDGAGNIFISDSANNRIRAVDAITNTIETVAGGADRGFSGDGEKATAAALDRPEGVFIDKDGNLFIADTDNHRIRRVDANTGIITTVAGVSTSFFGGFSGDGGPATEAELLSPEGVTMDEEGSLFIADTRNGRIRKVDADTGIITSVAGSDNFGVACETGPATETDLGLPTDVAVDPQGNLLVVDSLNDLLCKLDITTGLITSVAGSDGFGFAGDGGPATEANLSSPTDVAVDPRGNFFVVDKSNNRLRRVDAITSVISTVAGGGFENQDCDGCLATDSFLLLPQGVAIDSQSNLFIGDVVQRRVRRVDAATGLISSVAGHGQVGFSGDGGPATAAVMHSPVDVAVDQEGNLFIAEPINNRIRAVRGPLEGQVIRNIDTAAGNGISGFSGDDAAATDAALSFPEGVAFDSAGSLLIADTRNHRIRKVDAGTGTITTVAGNGDNDFSGDGGPATQASLWFPENLAVDTSGNFFIADSNNNRIRRVDAGTGTIATVAGNGDSDSSGDGGPATQAGLDFPTDVAVDKEGNLFIVDYSRIRKVDSATGIIITVAGNGQQDFSGDGGPATEAALSFPGGVAVDDEGVLFIADTSNWRIRKVDLTTGIITTLAGTGECCFSGDGGPAALAELQRPERVALDGRGNLLISDTGNQRIREVDLGKGTITTVAGKGTRDFSGDGGPATGATLYEPMGVAVDGQGNLFIADTQNNRIRMVSAP